MQIKEKTVRKFLSKKIGQLNNIVADLDKLVTEIGSDYFRVSIFGSARIKPETDDYKQVYKLAKQLVKNKVDIVTGGGPGLMEAANLGAKDVKSKSKSFGLHIDLPFETSPNEHLDITYHHKRFSSRLDEFMRISHAVIVTPGGIGTVLELLYTWQLIQVNHISKRPVILLGDMWNGLIEWMKSEPLRKCLIDGSDFDHIKVVQNIDDVVILLKPLINDFYKE
ncbi:MAG: LOG family protein [Candidatus Neomarinimicrobiota bacterium]|tara:strand:+ start:1720 stop:2388 length:669 start_codon:yes stop_codon:yes gene_type:complete